MGRARIGLPAVSLSLMSLACNSQEEMKCVCRAHPCWDDNGATHLCQEPNNHLVFHYDKDGRCIHDSATREEGDRGKRFQHGHMAGPSNQDQRSEE